MFNYLSDIFTSPFIIPLVAIVAGIGVPIISSAWIQHEKHKQECELKRFMVERGMSVEEIERVLAATAPAGPPKSRVTAFAEHMGLERTAMHNR